MADHMPTMTEVAESPPGFGLFIEPVFSLYTNLSASSDRRYIIGAGRRILRVLRNCQPADDDEDIYIETAIEVF